MSDHRYSLCALLLCATLLIGPFAAAEITDLRVTDPGVLPTNVYSFGCPVTEEQLTEVVDRRFANSGIQRASLDSQRFFYSAGVICRQHESGQHLYIIQIMFQKEFPEDIVMAFSHQGYQVNAGLGGAEEMVKDFSRSLKFSLSDYVRQNIWE